MHLAQLCIFQGIYAAHAKSLQRYLLFHNVNMSAVCSVGEQFLKGTNCAPRVNREYVDVS